MHLGQGDDYATARSRLGTDRLVGVSVATVADMTAAEAAGADYLGVSVWPARTKPEAIAVGLAGLRAVTAATQLPVVGIGGIAAANAGQVPVASTSRTSSGTGGGAPLLVRPRGAEAAAESRRRLMALSRHGSRLSGDKPGSDRGAIRLLPWRQIGASA